MTASLPFRDTFWNVPGWAQIALYVGGVLAIAIFAYGMWQRVSLWRRGLPEDRLDRIADRIGLVAAHALGQVRTLSQAYPGVMHAIMFWGFLALFMGTVLATIDWDIALPLFGYKLLKGHFYLFYETVLDLFGLFFVVGLGMAVWRRFVSRPPHIEPTARFAWALTLLFVINVTGFVMEACRLAVVEPWWGPWSPVGYALGRGFVRLGLTPRRCEGSTSRRGSSTRRSPCSSSRSFRTPISSISSRRPSTSSFRNSDRAARSGRSRTSRKPRPSASRSSRSSRGSGGSTSTRASSVAAARRPARRTCRARRSHLSRSS